ncbi:DUF732 domain-containing protein [Mycobacterium sp. SM1]|uniref:DUF732 domain-containing protein n=1 Tax=Mycobacterium sp. SM1 TaxID=2816243 RepID=UPI001BCDC8F0|nr:DUF732 domain-containing protein [Mycobacterium sp. SM1]MBS4728216.1 DUF732 domain-containing protein [Mycobacterium sp. SM1]
MRVQHLWATIAAGVALAAGTALAVPVHAEPGADITGTSLNDTAIETGSDAVIGAGFLAALNNAGITYRNPSQAVVAGQAVCGLMDNGVSGIEVIDDVKKANPAFSLDGAAKFAAIAANEFCPQHLQRT